MQLSSRQLDFHGRDLRLRDQLAIHGSQPLHLPERSAPFQASELHAQLITRLYGTLEFHIVESGEHEDFIIGSSATGVVRENRAHLQSILDYVENKTRVYDSEYLARLGRK